MNTKTKLYIVFLIGFFAIRWWLLNRNYLLDIGSKDIAILNDIASSYSGYNDIYVHGSAYTLFYLLLVNMFLPNRNNQVLLRMNRISYIRWLYWKMVFAAAMFTVVFVSVAVLFMTGTIGPQMLFKWGYYSVLLTLVLTFLYYVLMGTVFLFMYIVAGTKTKALFAVYFISVFLVGLPYFTRIYWTPVISLVVMDDMLESNIHIGKIMLNIVKLSGLSLFFIYLQLLSLMERIYCVKMDKQKVLKNIIFIGLILLADIMLARLHVDGDMLPFYDGVAYGASMYFYMLQFLFLPNITMRLRWEKMCSSFWMTGIEFVFLVGIIIAGLFVGCKLFQQKDIV